MRLWTGEIAGGQRVKEFNSTYRFQSLAWAKLTAKGSVPHEQNTIVVAFYPITA